MLSLLTAAQIHEADAYTIEHQPIKSINLMERASEAFTEIFTQKFPDKNLRISVYCGTGNNGGDGLAVARLLKNRHYDSIQVYVARFGNKSTADFDINFERLTSAGVPCTDISPGQGLLPDDSAIIIDALLGTGLNKPLTGDYARLVQHLNLQQKTVVAIDMPTGLFAEGELKHDAMVLKTDWLVTFQQPKISFLLPESGPYIHNWEAVNIGLDEQFIGSLHSPYQYIEEKDVRSLLKPRARFSHKGTYGHALLIAGQPETMGAALLSASACAHAGAGLTTACIPQSGLTALNAAQPEIMALIRSNDEMPKIDWEKYSAIAVGPGLGTVDVAHKLLKTTLKNTKAPLLLDADALNLLGRHPALWKHMPVDSILTPHMKEFDRLFGEHPNWWQRLQTARKKAMELHLYIVLKNTYTLIASPDGKCYFNPSGNAAMASGGMGDVLTGAIASLLAQQYTPLQACIIGVYVHGKAGDELALPQRSRVVLAGKVAAQLPVTMAGLA